jgi:hypothetical protein
MSPNLTIASGADNYTVDIGVISPLSRYFSCASKFGREASEGVIMLQQDAPAMVDIMVEFFHKSDYYPTLWKPDTNTDFLVWVRVCGSNPCISCENIDEHTPVSNEGVSSALSTQSFPTVGVVSSIISKKRAVTPETSRPNPSSLKRQRAAPSIPRGSGLALYHTPTPRHMLLHLQIWEVADKYLVPILEALCTQRFKEAAEYYHAHLEMIDAILFVYEDLLETATDLRKVIVSIVDDNPALLEDWEIQQSSFYQELCDAVALLNNGRTDRTDLLAGKSQWVQRADWPHVS